ncbi:MAG: twin transmembrane helix small protein [Gammaproteobacteria bacterium]|nr:twin transmembrane helix small protein [Gammaproteobacteria bacterium]
MKLVLLLILLAVIVSLGSGLFFLTRDSQGSARMLTALKIRVALSAALIGLLIVAYFMGWITPHSVPL